jgi:hypothetical protein
MQFQLMKNTPKGTKPFHVSLRSIFMKIGREDNFHYFVTLVSKPTFPCPSTFSINFDTYFGENTSIFAYFELKIEKKK